VKNICGGGRVEKVERSGKTAGLGAEEMTRREAPNRGSSLSGWSVTSAVYRYPSRYERKARLSRSRTVTAIRNCSRY